MFLPYSLNKTNMELFAESDLSVDQEDLIVVSYTEDSFFRYHENAGKVMLLRWFPKFNYWNAMRYLIHLFTFRIDFLLINHCKWKLQKLVLLDRIIGNCYVVNQEMCCFLWTVFTMFETIEWSAVHCRCIFLHLWSSSCVSSFLSKTLSRCKEDDHMHDMRAAEETKASSLLDSSTRDCVLTGPPFTARAPSSRLEHRIQLQWWRFLLTVMYIRENQLEMLLHC